MMIEQLELRNQLQTLWQDLSANPRNRALAVATVVSHHGDEETIRIFGGLIERQTPLCDEREQALNLLKSPPPTPVSPIPPLPKPAASPQSPFRAAIFLRPDVPYVPPSPLEQRLEALWQSMALTPGNRALVLARMVVHYGDVKLRLMFAKRIALGTPPGAQREQALRLLQDPPPLSTPLVSPATILPQGQSAPLPSLEQDLELIWHELAGNPRNRALSIAHIVAHHGGEALRERFAARIEAQTPWSEQRRQALRLLRPSTPFSHIHIGNRTPANHFLPVDPELARLAILFDCAAEMRIWVVAVEVTRSEKGSGVISKKALKEALKAFGITYTPRHINRLLTRGEGLFWSASANNNIYIRSWINLSVAMAHKAAAHGIDLDLNKPGVRRVLLYISGSLEDWEAEIYAGWIAHRDGLTIARVTLSQLFGRDPNTLRRWEAKRLKGQVTLRRNYVQCSDVDRYFRYLPDHTTEYVARYLGRDDEYHIAARIRWQLPNSYFSSAYDTAKRGQASKVRRAVNAEYPPAEERGGQCELRYLKSTKRMKRLYHSLKFRMGLKGDIHRPFYVFLGRHYRTGQGIFEITTTGFVFTEINERMSRGAEKDYREIEERKRKRAYQASLHGKEESENGTFSSPT